MLKLETLFMLVNICIMRVWPQIFEKSAKPYLEIFLEKSLNFGIKLTNFEHL